jgi:hypothetical protein
LKAKLALQPRMKRKNRKVEEVEKVEERRRKPPRARSG